MSNKTKHNKKELIEAMIHSHCIVTDACDTVGVSRKTYYDYLKNDQEFKKEIDDIQNTALDFVEGELYKRIEKGDTTAIIFYLKTKGSTRGYIEKQQIDQNTNITISDKSELGLP
jgi:hypothetical protein